IVRVHSLIWPAILMALDVPLPKKIYGHGWITFGGGKMSKSSGNVIDPFILADRYGVDALRYHLLREMPYGSDCPYNNEMMFNRINSDLANDLGNLVSRTVAMAIKYFDGTLPADKEFTDADGDLLAQLDGLPSYVEENYESFHIADALERIFRVIARANKYIDENEPWVLAKDDAKKPRLAAVLYNLLDAIRRCTILLSPAMPNTAPAIYEQIGASDANTKWEDASVKHGLPADVTVKKGPVLFPRIDVEKELAELDAMSAPKRELPEEPLKELTKFDNFAALDLRAVKVLQCERVPKSDKLLKFIVDDGFGERQVLSGIAKYYKPEDLIGKTLAMIVNLEPRKMMGFESNGMIMSVRDGDKFRVVEFADDIKPGADIS
ncbi:MAG: methionine--tRNA ligase subunit beta, partial [Clostridiales bacterium]|nr:methionine--tRNA ligase subunit beta [Clostridiales bacterium]